MEMTRAEHLAWAKRRAFEYLERGELESAANSMLSDLGKHEELASLLTGETILLLTIQMRDRILLGRWITGFN